MANDGDSDDDGQTKSTATRWWFTNDAVALYLIATLPVMLTLQAAGYLGELNTQVFAVYATCVTLAAIWAFGEKTVTALMKLRGKNK